MKEEISTLRNELQDALENLDDQYEYVDYLEKRVNHLDQYGRRENVEIAGIPGHVTNANLETEVLKILAKIGLTNIQGYDIVACHRLRTKDEYGNKNTIVRFVNRKDAILTLKSRRNLYRCRELGYTNLSIFENLCPVFRSIHENLKVEEDKGKIAKMWTYNGIINYKLTDFEKETPKKIHTQRDFDELMNKFGG